MIQKLNNIIYVAVYVTYTTVRIKDQRHTFWHEKYPEFTVNHRIKSIQVPKSYLRWETCIINWMCNSLRNNSSKKGNYYMIKFQRSKKHTLLLFCSFIFICFSYFKQVSLLLNDTDSVHLVCSWTNMLILITKCIKYRYTVW